METKKSTTEIISNKWEEIEELKREGIDPFGYSFNRTYKIKDLIEKNKDLQIGECGQEKVSIAGRLMALRAHGKAIFANIEDVSGRIQIYIKSNKVGGDAFKLFSKIGVGDILGVSGLIFRTRTGEITVFVEEFTLLCKSVRSLPEKWHGLKDVEVRYRKRYLDLIANPSVREIFIKRSKVVQSIRNFLDNRSFLEVQTPIMQPIPGGATARPFITHHNTLHRDLYLRIATELYLKRLIVGGLEKVYELGCDFRNEGISTKHNPEFTMLELYEAYGDYHSMMTITEELLTYVIKNVLGGLEVEYQGNKINFTPPWKRISMYKAIEEVSGINMKKILQKDFDKIIKEHDLNIKGKINRGEITNELFGKYVEPTLIQPTFIFDYPLEISPLSKQKKDNPELVERFELFVNSMELANAFTELNDPAEQKRRFEEQVAKREAGDMESHFMDEDYIEALEYGMPPTGGLGIGIDRLIMLLTNSDSIKEVILFPQLKSKE
ncbi:lysine--tRNA ligase [bacterium]|nr:lysine--tRNA ligase [bacterium]MBU1290462.1 lysine--tRNA ligase [bacterium]MBU1428509.1 lysine--tRNA ligase [bacterium]MBU2439435.1 lysine--tRNA ligase [bacterium]